MTISERLFYIMDKKGITMPELSRMTGISRHTIYDWQRRGTNPGAEKIMIICESLMIHPEELLLGEFDHKTEEYVISNKAGDIEIQILKECKGLNYKNKRRLLAYAVMLGNNH